MQYFLILFVAYMNCSYISSVLIAKSVAINKELTWHSDDAKYKKLFDVEKIKTKNQTKNC